MATYNQQKSGSEIDDILQCPICYELPKPPIYQCDRGHHFCEHCYEKLMLAECPLCKSQFYGTRNYLAEELVQKLPGLLISLPASPPLTTTTEERLHESTSTAAPTSGTPPPLCRGSFPCAFKSCRKVLPAGRMLPHLRYHHPTMLSEVVCPDKFKEVWELEYQPDSIYETAIRISNMGLFYLMVNMRHDGALDALVQMVASVEVASAFNYKIKVSGFSGQRKITYSNTVLSCRQSPAWIRDKGLCLLLSAVELSNMCRHGNSIHCQLSIKYSVKETVSSTTPSRTRSLQRRTRQRAYNPAKFYSFE